MGIKEADETLLELNTRDKMNFSLPFALPRGYGLYFLSLQYEGQNYPDKSPNGYVNAAIIISTSLEKAKNLSQSYENALKSRPRKQIFPSIAERSLLKIVTVHRS